MKAMDNTTKKKLGANIYLAGGAHFNMPEKERLSGGALAIAFNNNDLIPQGVSGFTGVKGSLAYSSGIWANIKYNADSISMFATSPTTNDPMKANYFHRTLLSEEDRNQLAPGLKIDVLAAHSYKRSYKPFFNLYRAKTGRNLLNKW